MNPYHGLTFSEFIFCFFSRILALISGNISIRELATDEIQVLVIAGVALSSALVGTFLVLRRMTMLANSLSHTILIGIVITFIFSAHHQEVLPTNTLLLACLVVGFLTTFLTEFISRVGRLQEEASVGLVFTSLFALGVILVTLLTRNAHIGIEAVMGNADALHVDDLHLVFLVLLLNVTLLILFFRGFKLTAFDPKLAHALGFSTTFFNYLLMAQVSATTIGAFRAVGVLLVLAFITGPVLTARLLTSNLIKLILIAMTIGFLSSLVGVALSRHLLSIYGMALSTSGVVVCVIGIFYALILVLKSLKLSIHKRGLKTNSSLTQ